jgi:hypothetical protein
MTEETKEVQNEKATSQEATPAADLNISDLMALKSIVEVASQRGAFKAAELETVGKTFNKLNTFLEAVASAKKED